jgi:hypothetical protein
VDFTQTPRQLHKLSERGGFHRDGAADRENIPGSISCQRKADSCNYDTNGEKRKIVWPLHAILARRIHADIALTTNREACMASAGCLSKVNGETKIVALPLGRPSCIDCWKLGIINSRKQILLAIKLVTYTRNISILFQRQAKVIEHQTFASNSIIGSTNILYLIKNLFSLLETACEKFEAHSWQWCFATL